MPNYCIIVPWGLSFRGEAAFIGCSGQTTLLAANQDVYFSPDGLRFHSRLASILDFRGQHQASWGVAPRISWFSDPVLKPFPFVPSLQAKADIPSPEPKSEAVAEAQQNAVAQALLIGHKRVGYRVQNSACDLLVVEQEVMGSKHRPLQMQSKRGMNFSRG